MSIISNQNIAEAIYLASKDETNRNISFFVNKVIKFLSCKRLLLRSKDILNLLEKIFNEERGLVYAKISSKETLNTQTKKELNLLLSKKYNAKEILFSESLNEKLLGGFKIEIKNEIIDLTIHNKLKKLQEYLTIKK
ncbi:MAG: F0F1 ATP synthase subunit delta [Patescibacteria group bacterium]